MYARLLCTLSFCLASVPQIASADFIVLGATDAGFVTEMGGTAKGDGTLVPSATYNYFVGQEEHYADGSLGIPPGTTPLAYMDRKNYFIFDLTSVDKMITSASLKVYMGPDIPPAFPGGMHGYESSDPFETFDILETTDPGMGLGIADDLLFGNSLGPGVFDEPTDPMVMAAKDLYGVLGDGATLASITVSSADDDTTLSIDFDPAGIAYLNMFLGEKVILAGALTTTDGTETTQGIFGFVGPDIAGGTDPLIPDLELMTVPEPNSAMLFAILSMVTLGSTRIRPRSRRS